MKCAYCDTEIVTDVACCHYEIVNVIHGYYDPNEHKDGRPKPTMYFCSAECIARYAQRNTK